MDVTVYPKKLQSGTLEAAAHTVPPKKPLTTEAATSSAEAVVQSQKALLKETLQLHGYKPSAENMQMLGQMLDAGIPLTKENIAHMHQAFKMTGNLEQALFLLQNNIPTTVKNVTLLNALAEGQVKISAQITSLLDNIAQLPDSALKDVLVKLLANLSNLGKAPSDAPVQQTTQAAETPGGQEAQAAPVPAKIIPQAMPRTPAFIAGLAEAATAPGNSSAAPQANTVPAHTSPQGAVPRQGAVVQPLPVAPQGAPVAVAPEAAQPTVAARAYNTFQAPAPEAPPAPAAQAPAPPTPAATPAQAAASEAQPAQVQANAPSPVPIPQAPLSGQADAGNNTPVQANPADGQQTTAPQAEPPALTDLRSSLSLPLQNSSVQDIEDFLNGLRESLAQAQIAIENNPGAARVSQSLRALAEYIDFAAQIKNQLFVEIPLHIHDMAYNTALYVKKDKAGSKQKTEGTGSALIALDTANLGHFETYVQKEGQAIRCQFRLENEEIEQLVRANIHLLDAQLKDHRYMLDAFTFITGERPFNLLDSLDEEEKSSLRSDTIFDTMV